MASRLEPNCKVYLKLSDFFSYSMVNQFKKPSGIKLDIETNKRLQSTVKYICEETGNVLYDNQIG